MIARSVVEIAHMVSGALELGHASNAVDLPAVKSVVIDSRKVTENSLFVAISGQHVDGQQYLSQAAAAGAAAAIVSDLGLARSLLGEKFRCFPLIVVADTVRALGDLARAHLADIRKNAQKHAQALTVLGITGSVGKTTTKDLTKQILSAQGQTVAPVASFNNEIGLPLTVLETDARTRYLVLEMGASAPGHIAYLTSIAPLDVALVLMVGQAHLGGFGSLDGVARAKQEIIADLNASGTAIVNFDDARTLAMSQHTQAKVLTFSASGNPQADLYATNVQLDDHAQACCDFHFPGVARPFSVHLQLPGRHNVANALAAAALAWAAQLSPEIICQSLQKAVIQSRHRMALHEVSFAGKNLLILDDSYNANLDSLAAALTAFPTIAAGKRKVAIISEMLELGKAGTAAHARAGQLAITAGVELLVTIGAGAAAAAEAARAGGVECLELPDAAAALTLLASAQTPLRDGDAVLLKGSHGSGAVRVADYLLADLEEDHAS